MLVLISDANVLIDLEVGGIVERLFRLGDTIAVPDVLFEEELRAQHANLVTLGLRVMLLEGEAFLRVAAWAQRYPKPSRNDWLAYALAQQVGGVLLTGDGDLRTAIATEQTRVKAGAVKVHGTVWLLKRLQDKGALSVSEVRAAADLMKRDGRRLPWDAIDELLHRPPKKPRRS